MTARKVYLDGRRVRVQPSAHIGSGGEAEVYDLGDGRALKLFKSPEHQDFSGKQALQCAARQRLDIHQSKLTDFPAALPERVIGPRSLATDRKRAGRIVGYAMPLIAGAEHLYRYAEPRFRRRAGAAVACANQVVDVLVDLRDTVAGVHAAGVVIGDFNDLNVLVRERRAFLIDADSFQYGRYPCRVFTTRFVDPLLCDSQSRSPILARAYNRDSDWYAFAVMVMRSLLCVGPYGGIHRPPDSGRRMAHAYRPLARKTVFASDVVYPKPAIHYSRLPDELLNYLHATFVKDVRTALPVNLLMDLRWTRCRSCGAEHARAGCPLCTGKPQIVPAPGQLPTTTRSVIASGKISAHEVVRFERAIVVDAAVHLGELRWLSWDERVVRNRHGRQLRSAVSGEHLGERSGEGPAPYRGYVCHGDLAFRIERGHVTLLIDADAEPQADRARSQSGTRAVAARVVDPPPDDLSGRSAFACDGQRTYWLQGGSLRASASSPGGQPVVLGQVLRRQTRIWLGREWSFGMYRAGGLTVGFSYRPSARGINDRLTMPRLRGPARDIHAVVGDDRVWLSWSEQSASQRVFRCACILANGQLLCTVSLPEDASQAGSGRLAQWLPFARGGCAVGRYLFVPTDAGLVRVEHRQGRLDISREFPESAPYLDSSARLLCTRDGLHAVSARAITRLTMN